MPIAADAAEQAGEADDTNEENCTEDGCVHNSGGRDPDHYTGMLSAELQTGGDESADGSDGQSEYQPR